MRANVMTVCPQCSAAIAVAEDASGTTIRCPECAYAFVVPATFTGGQYAVVPPSERAYSRLFILFVVLFPSVAFVCAAFAGIGLWLYATHGPGNRREVIENVGSDFHLSVREAGDAMSKATTNDKEALAAAKAIDRATARVRTLPGRLQTIGKLTPEEQAQLITSGKHDFTSDRERFVIAAKSTLGKLNGSPLGRDARRTMADALKEFGEATDDYAAALAPPQK
jgi:DNA-directed RNA polymerase subunit RPC12/RpoP